jgi:hypothetical protein
MDTFDRLDPDARWLKARFSYGSGCAVDRPRLRQDMKSLRRGVVRLWPSLAWAVAVEMEPRKDGPLKGRYVPHLQCVAVSSREPPTVQIGVAREELRALWGGIVMSEDLQHSRNGVYVARASREDRHYPIARKKRQSAEERAAILDEWPQGVGKAITLWNEEALPFAPEYVAWATAMQAEKARSRLTGAVWATQRAIGSEERVSPEGWNSLSTNEPMRLLDGIGLEWEAGGELSATGGKSRPTNEEASDGEPTNH